MDFIALRKGDIIQATDYVATDISFHVVGDTASVGHSWNKTAYFPMYRKTSGTGVVQAPNKRNACRWKYVEDGYWHTSCGEDWCFPEGSPVDNGLKYCPICGKRASVR